MTKRIRVVLTIAVAVVLAYPAAAWVFGVAVEKQDEANQQKMLADTPYIVRTKRDYHRGIFSAVEQLTYQISLPTAKGAADRKAIGPWQFTTHCVIHHGPLPGLRAFALATADCDLDLPAEASEKVRAALGGKPLLEAHGRTGWLGGSTTALTSPAFTLKLDDGTTVNWRGITGTLEAGRELATWSGSFSTPGLTAERAETHAEIGAMTFTAHMREVYDTLYVGEASVKLADATAHSAGLDVALKGVTISGLSSQSGDYVDSAVELAMDAVETKQFSATRVGYAVRLKHAHGPSLAALSQAMRDVQREALTEDAAAFRSKLREAFREPGIDVLLHDPVLEIPRIGFVMPEGEARLRATLRAPGLTREDLQGPALGAAILGHLQAEADFAIDAALLDKMLSANPNAEAMHQQLATLQRQGYVKAVGTQYTTHVTYEHGKTALNGLPFPPAPPK